MCGNLTLPGEVPRAILLRLCLSPRDGLPAHLTGICSTLDILGAINDEKLLIGNPEHYGSMRAGGIGW